MWQDVECVSEVKPPARDDESSDAVVYIRKDFVFHRATMTPDGEEVPARWTYKETTVPKDAVELLNMADEASASIEAVEEALCDLSLAMEGA